MNAHVVQQLFVDFSADEKTWSADVRFDAGIALPEMREDKLALQPKREWLTSQTPAGHVKLREEAEKYLRKCLHLQWSADEVKTAQFSVEFPEWESTPPEFAAPYSDLGFAYFTMRCTGVIPESGGDLELSIAEGEHPDFMFGFERVGSDQFITAYPGKTTTLWTAEAAPPSAQQSFLSFLDYGYRHVIPEGWDHVLFIAALCCLSLQWRPLLTQSLVFTLGHTLTLGLCISGVLPAFSAGLMVWVEILIAGTIVYVAVENLISKKIRPHRLITIFLFGLVHGLGFASVLGDAIRASGNISLPLIAANLGVELGQVTIIGMLFLCLYWAREKPFFTTILKAISTVIAVVGSYWVIERLLG